MRELQHQLAWAADNEKKIEYTGGMEGGRNKIPGEEAEAAMP